MRKCIVVKLDPGADVPAWLLSSWENLAAKHTEIRLFQSPIWVLNYWKYRYREPRELRLLVGKEGEEVIGITPWVVHAHRFLPRLSTWRTVHAVGEYDADWVCHPQYRQLFVEMACDYLKREQHSWFRYMHSAMREDSGVLERLGTECRSRGIPFRYQQSREIPFLETTDPKPVEQRLAGKHRQETRRKARNLSRLDSVTFEDVTPDETQSLRSALGELFSVEAAGWKGRAGTAIIKNPRAEGFWRAFAGDAAKRGLLRLHLMRLGDRTIAGQLGVVFGDTYYSLKLGYDEQFRTYGPGALIMGHTIQSCIDDPLIKTYDFAGPAMPYMRSWTSTSRRAGTVMLGTPRRGFPTLFQLRWYARKQLAAARRTLRS